MMFKKVAKVILIFCGALLIQFPGFAQNNRQYDIIVYGGNGGAIMAAIAARQAGASVLLLSPDKHIGGVTSSGLGWTDIGNPSVIGGLARTFYHQVFLHYQNDAAWKSANRDEYQKKLYGIYQVKDSLMWTFEPHVAEAIFNRMLKKNDVSLKTGIKLDRDHKLEMNNGRIASISMTDGSRYVAKVFIDASYEGDLMAMAGIDYTVGREANAKYGESINGVEKSLAVKNNLPKGIDPYRIKGDPESGIMQGVNARIDQIDGAGDDKLQAYCYRMCLTNDPANRIKVQKPEGYQKADFELVIRATALGEKRLWKLSALPNRKIDANNDCGISMDAIGWNKGYVDASDKDREVIAARHRYWTLGLIWTVQNDPRVPSAIRKKFDVWGLPKDEFKDNGHFPYSLYVREARRMVSDYVMSEKDVLQGDAKNAIAMGAYVMDSHNTQRYITDSGYVQNEGDVQIPVKNPYPIPYGTIIPKRSQCQNLLVPVCLSASHIAYGSIRMEPVFMVIGQSAGIAAAAAVKNRQPVQDVSYTALKKSLLEAAQILTLPGK